jgi:cell division initiation protein
MKITPLEIRQKTFEKAFRGLDKDEVDAFLTTLSTEWEKLMDENKEYRIKLESSEREVQKLREVENSLFKTLKTAEDTGANMIDQATKTAQLHMRETEMKAEGIMNESKSKAKNMLEEAEMRSRNAVEDMEDRLRSMAQLYRTLENVKDDLISDIKSFANEAIDKTNRVKDQIKKVNIEEELLKINRASASKMASKQPEMELKFEKIEKEPTPKPEPAQELKVDVEEKIEEIKTPKPKMAEESKSTSFFDDID